MDKKHKGVSYHKSNNKYRAYIGHNKEIIHLGYFDDFQDAVSAREKAEEKYGKSIIGKKYGRLTVISKSEKTDKGGNTYYNCACDCGKETVVRYGSLNYGGVKSCGCLQKEITAKNAAEMDKEKCGWKDGTSLSNIKSNHVYSNNKTGVRGVTLYGGTRYRAEIRVKQKLIYLGIFDTLEDAKKARELAEEKYFKPIINKYSEGKDDKETVQS